ncbi:MAG: FG-GAP-like repeat-containing protein [Polyangiaceae bacterium]
MRRFRLSSLKVTLASLALLSPLAAHNAGAAWPPPETATAKDMADPVNWPNDPDYAFTDKNDGAWNYYSFMPSVAVNVRPEETASGMSIDLAWRYTIGDPSVKIVVTDSGIKWDSYDLVDSAYLNAAELANHKPTMADGTACGGEGALAGFDCNGDGMLSVSDYKDTPALQPEASDGHPKGDKNNNGLLDAGDIILNFSDGVDDDQNGYTDDISGWDFMKNDNDPYDDTRYGHGTGEANDSTAAANNGAGSAGVCPKCRFIPARVGDSFITDATWFAKAVVYAADNDVSIVQCALGTIDMNTFTQQALDYAYEKNVLVITSMADENARHHNVPAAANHTLPVHAIQYDGSSLKTSTTFLAFHPCSNFGGQNFLSASGTGCSSEATGRLSGIAGLVYSAAKKYNVPLRPGEAASLFFMTADDINVTDSQKDGSSYKWSQPGFDQRFGYGRVNANRAVEAIKDKKIPPSVDVTEPRWFSVLYKDQVQGPVDIVGTVSAPLANTYDYVVEWAPGVQPLDGEFKVFKEMTNIPPETVAGSDGPLASLEIRDLKIDNPPHRDSPYGENRYTITVRVRSVAHYGGMKGDVPGEMRRTYYVHADETLVKGFPVFVGASGETSAKMADLDGDGVREIVYPTSAGEVHALRIGANGPEELPGFPFRTNRDDGLVEPPPTPSTPSYLAAPAYASGGVNPDLGREAIMSAPGVADLDGDGSQEIVVSAWAGTIYVIGTDGKTKPGWPKRLPEVPSCPLDPAAPKPSPCMDTKVRIARGAFASPVLVDMNKDGKLDIVQAAFDGNVYVFDAQGNQLEGWPVNIHYTGELSNEPDRNRILTTPAAADFTGDGIPDLVVGSNEKLGSGGQAGAVYLIDGRGMATPGGPIVPGWPVGMTSLELFPLVAEGVTNSPVAAEFEGKVAAVAHGNATSPLILPIDPGTQQTIAATPTGSLPVRPDPNDPSVTSHGLDPSSVFGELSLASTPNTMFPLFAQPSAGDIDQDGVPDVVASGGSLTLVAALQNPSAPAAGDHLLAAWSGKTGHMLPGAPFILEDFTFFNSQAIADLNGDDYPEILTGSGGYYLHAYDGCGREPAGWPKFTGQWIISTPALGDIDGDGNLEVAIGTRSGWLYAWHTGASAKDSIVEWESYHHDNRNTGFLSTPLDQGAKKLAATPLTVEVCTAEPEIPEEPIDPNAKGGGGCDCTTTPAGGSSLPHAGWAFAAALGLLASRRRRTRTPHTPRRHTH